MSLTETPPPIAPEDEPRRRRWTRDEYYRAADMGLFGPGERLELIRGEIITKVSPQKTPHAVAIRLAQLALEAAFGGIPCDIRPQLPMTLPDDSEPEPDVLVVRGGPRDYETRHPGAADVLLLVEVSDTTLALDRRVKAALYAEAGIAEYWIVNLPERQVEAHRDPREGVYRGVSIVRDADNLAPLAALDTSIRVADLLPSPTA